MLLDKFNTRQFFVKTPQNTEEHKNLSVCVTLIYIWVIYLVRCLIKLCSTWNTIILSQDEGVQRLKSSDYKVS